MQALGINLRKRPDRLAYCVRQCEQVGLDFRRVDAVDADGVDPQLAELTGLKRSQIACWQSHQAAWTQLVNSDLEGAVVVEDDVIWLRDPGSVFGYWRDRPQERPEILQLGSLATVGRGALKREVAARTLARVVQSTVRRVPSSRSVISSAAPLMSAPLSARRVRKPATSVAVPAIVHGFFGAGTHAYLISRRQAARLLEVEFNTPPLLPADNALDALAKAGGFSVGQLLVAVAGQALFPSDVR
jgi:GR25 family glycosyltransferase involved in LPS biosynthesis